MSPSVLSGVGQDFGYDGTPVAVGISAGWLVHEGSFKSKQMKTLPTSICAAKYD